MANRSTAVMLQVSHRDQLADAIRRSGQATVLVGILGTTTTMRNSGGASADPARGAMSVDQRY